MGAESSRHAELAALAEPYRPRPVIDTDIIQAEVATSGISMSKLSKNMGKIHSLALDLLGSLQTTIENGQRVDGEIVSSPNPLTAAKNYIQNLAMTGAVKEKETDALFAATERDMAAAKKIETREELPEGVQRVTVMSRVSGAWLVRPEDGGKNFTLPDNKTLASGRLNPGDEIFVSSTGITNEHGRLVVKQEPKPTSVSSKQSPQAAV